MKTTTNINNKGKNNMMNFDQAVIKSHTTGNREYFISTFTQKISNTICDCGACLPVLAAKAAKKAEIAALKQARIAEMLQF